MKSGRTEITEALATQGGRIERVKPVAEMKAQQEPSIRHDSVMRKESVRLPKRIGLRFGGKHTEICDAAVIHINMEDMAGA